MGADPTDIALSTPTRLSSGAVVSKIGPAVSSSSSSHQHAHHHQYHQNPNAAAFMQGKRNSLKGGGGARRPSLKYRVHRPTPSNVGGATTPVSGGSGVQPSVSIIKRKLSHGNSLSFYGPTATTSDDGGIISGGGIRLVNEDEPLFDDNAGGGVSTTGLNDGESQHPMMPNTGFSYVGGTQISHVTTQLYDKLVFFSS